MTADEIASVITEAAARNGVPIDALMAIANLESSGNVRAQNPRSSASGLFQFVDSTAREYGLTGNKRNDPVAQAEAAAKMMATNARSLERTLGRPAAAGELYLAHQQGLTGATALLRNPNRPAVDVLTDVYGDRGRAAQAVRLNGGETSQSAGQFANQWVSKANQRASLIPPGELPQVATAQSTTRPPVAGTPTPLPAMLAAQRNLQPTTQDTASLYKGILPEQQAQAAPLPSMVFGSGIKDSFAAANAANSPDLAASLASYLAPKPSPAMRQPSAAEKSALAYVAPPQAPRITTVASIPTTPPRTQLPELPPSNTASPRMIETSMQRAAAAQDPRLAAALAAPRAPAQPRLPNAQERSALAYVAPPAAPANPRIGQPPATRAVASVPVRPSIPGPMDDVGSMGSFADFQTAMAPPRIPGPSAPPKIGEERLIAGAWGVPSIAGLPALPDVGVATALSVIPPLPMARPSRPRPFGMPTPLSQRPTQPMPQRAPSRSIFSMPTSAALRPTNRPPLNVVVQGARTQQPSGGSSSSSSPSSGFVHNGQQVYATPTQRYNAATNEFETVTTYKPR